ncbi:MAG TPA: DUF1800 family protein [Ilumatobacteraceae bacterium]|nr:DUF1800 family protein [Ilumatobacteraceae bacterium]
MDNASQVSWLHRRAGLGLHPDQLNLQRELPAADVLSGLLAQEPVADPWADLVFDNKGERADAIVAWLAHLRSSASPYVDRRTWNLHGWLVSAIDKVPPAFMVEQIRMFSEIGGGPFPDLLRRLSVDRAMLVYLDGRQSTAGAPNENYGRELLELFALGIGNYTETDVKAAARALTGWAFSYENPEATLVARRHDDSPQTLLGVGGVHDVDSVVDAIVAQPAHGRFVANKVVEQYLGDPQSPPLTGIVDDLADRYRADPRLDAMIAVALEHGLGGARSSMVLAPLPWLVMALRACNLGFAQLPGAVRPWLRQSGQIPLLPPGVEGWPVGADWLNSSAIVARANVAAAIAGAIDSSEPCAVAASDADPDRLAMHLGLSEPFAPTTASAIRNAPDPTARLTLALIAPENLLA